MMTARLSGAAFLLVITTLFLQTKGQYRGHWEKTWRTPSTARPGMNIGIAFSGENTVSEALRLSANVSGRLRGTRYISFGGGNPRGRWYKGLLDNINRAMTSDQLQGYQGIVYDVEEGDSGLSRDFAHSFRLAKRNNFHVIVAVSHTAPYGIPDKVALMQSFLSDRSIDILSPMMYESGNRKFCETGNSLSTQPGQVSWGEFRKSKAKVVPSLLHARVYSDAQDFLRLNGVTTHGYIVWCA